MIIPVQTTTRLISTSKLTIFCGLLIITACSSSSRAPISDRSATDRIPSAQTSTPQENSSITGKAYQDDSIKSSPLFDNADPYKNQKNQSRGDILSDPNQSPLAKVEELVNIRSYKQAQSIAQRIDRSRLSLQEQTRLNLAEAQIFSALNENQNALERLNTIKPSLLSIEDNARFFWLKARTNYQLGNQLGALEALADRENYISSGEISTNKQMMKNILSTFTPQQQQNLSQNTQNPNLLYWLDSNNFSRNSNIQILPSTGPLANTTKNSIPSTWPNNSPKQIAVLLPYRSNFANAAKQFETGFNQAHNSNTSNLKPQLRFYDVGNGDIRNKMSIAIQNGADFIVGPLGKRDAEVALATTSPVPILAIGGQNFNQSNKYTFSLSPEAEGVAIAQHARSKGYQRAIILTPNIANNTRLSDAFQSAWQSLGGSTQTYEFSKGEFDHSATVKLALGIYASEQRYNELSGIIGNKPKFNANPKGGIDMILLASNFDDAKNLKPQINFFNGHKLPTYGSSSLNRLSALAGEKADLDGLIIPEMTALIDTTNNTSTNPQAPRAKISRLEALGFDSYQLIPIINTLNQQTYYQGKTGKLLIDTSGNIIRNPSWAKFSSGKLKAIQ